MSEPICPAVNVLEYHVLVMVKYHVIFRKFYLYVPLPNTTELGITLQKALDDLLAFDHVGTF